MSSPAVFITGAVITLILIKPTVGTAIIDSMSSVSHAAFDRHEARYEPQPPQPPVVKAEEVIEEVITEEKPDKLAELVTAIKLLVERVDRIELQNTNKQDIKLPTAKEAAYQQALERQAAQEKMAGYDGNDPSVRSRLGLPPKVPPFDLFMVDGEMDKDQFDRAFATRSMLER